jgi:hypothetical protein
MVVYTRTNEPFESVGLVVVAAMRVVVVTETIAEEVATGPMLVIW